jgi:signal-transduction protein with cAMP-binding, CBS, and nucleotidyltransferase domain
MNKLSVEFLLEIHSETRNVISIAPTDTVLQATEVLKKNKVGLVLVFEDKKMVGVLSERDIVQRWVGSPIFPKDVEVKEIMTKDVECVTCFDTIWDCYLRFVARGCRHLPVLDPTNQVLGVLSLRNVADYIVNHLGETQDKKIR